MHELEKYWSAKDLVKRYRCGKSTIYNWMESEENPFPKPIKFGKGIRGKVLWVIEDVIKWDRKAQ
mgnify:CR=1 FL=1